MRSIQNRIYQQRADIYRQGDYVEERDNTLRNRYNRVMQKGREYVDNINQRQGYGKNSWENGTVIRNEDMNKKYSRSSYITAG